jgi:hypothetical protein
MILNWKIDAGDHALIVQIAERAQAMAKRFGTSYPQVVMDLTAVHANGCPLRLDELLASGDGDFGHDIFGIRRFWNPKAAKLEQCFRPRFAK